MMSFSAALPLSAAVATPQAAQMLHEAATARLDALGKEHPDTLEAMQAIAVVSMDERHFSTAASILGDVVRGHAAALGAGHASTLLSRRLQAEAEDGMGRRERAIQILRDGVEASRAERGHWSPLTLEFCSRLGKLILRETTENPVRPRTWR